MVKNNSKDLATTLEIKELKNIGSDVSLLDTTSRVEVVGCDLQSITLNFKGIKCAIGHLILIIGYLSIYSGVKSNISFVGKITELKTNLDQSQWVVVRLSQYDKVLWSQFIEELSRQQKYVDKLLEAIKGEN